MWSRQILSSAVLGLALCQHGIAQAQNPGPSATMSSRAFLMNPSASEILGILKLPPILRPEQVTTDSLNLDQCANKSDYDLRGPLTGATSPLPPVSSQGKSCQSCWVHAAASAIDTSWRYLQHEGEQLSSSKQEMLDCASQHAAEIKLSSGAYNCEGGSHEIPFSYAQVVGVLQRSSYPPQILSEPRKDDDARSINGKRCPSPDPQNVGARIQIATWDYVPRITADGDGTDPLIASTQNMKRALCLHGGVVSWINARGWDTKRYWSSLQQQEGKLTYIIGEKTPVEPRQLNGYAHIVQIVGWRNELILKDSKGQDIKDANGQAIKGYWIIKNSWGDTWADNGYALIPYGYQSIGLFAAWVHAAIPPLPEKDMKALAELQRKLPEPLPEF